MKRVISEMLFLASLVCMYVCIVKGQGFISPVDTGRQRAHTPSPSDSQLYLSSIYIEML